MTLTRIRLERFTAFEKLDLELSPGINIFIGENGTGKTHLLKIAYSACDITQTKGSFASKLIRTFLPYQRRLGRLVFRTGKSARAVAEIYRDGLKLRSSFSNHAKEPKSAVIRGKARWIDAPVQSAYVPVKEMLAHAPGFRSLYASREVHKDMDKVRYHSLFRDDAGKIGHDSTDDFFSIHPNAIVDTFADLYDREIRRSLRG